jgi:hypothetical protein
MSATIAFIMDLIETGEFHHATHRNVGTRCFECLAIYVHDENKFNEFRLECQVPAYAFRDGNWTISPEFQEASELVSKFGTSVGSHGNG